MFLRCVWLGILFVLLFLLSNIFLIKIKAKYLFYKEQKEKKARQKAFKNKIKELEIK